MPIRPLLIAALLSLFVASPALPAQTAAAPATDDGARNALHARAVLDAMVKALGGPAWLEMKNRMRHGHIAAFYQDKPDLGTTEYWEYHQWPGYDRIELTKHRDVLQIYLDRTGWEVTFRGKKALPKDITEDFLRRRDHSIETAVKLWLPDSKTILVYDGKQMAGSHLCDQVTLISEANESITILADETTHLPLKRIFQWRDPVYKDKNTDAEEYDNYHLLDGLPTPLRITRYKNGEMFRQYYIDRVEFNRALGADFWDVDAQARRIRK